MKKFQYSRFALSAAAVIALAVELGADRVARREAAQEDLLG